MTTQEALDWFDLLQDKFGSPYFNDDQKLLFLNNAQNEYVNKLFPSNEDGIVNVETDWNIIQNIGPLIYELSPTVMGSSGTLDTSALVTDLQSLSGDSSADIYKILSIEFKRGLKRYPCKVLRHNDKAAFEANYFKKPTKENPRYLIQNNVYQFRPTDTTVSILITVLKTPRIVSISPDVQFELPETTHNEIVAYGLQFAGIASRDEVLSAMNLYQLPKNND